MEAALRGVGISESVVRDFSPAHLDLLWTSYYSSEGLLKSASASGLLSVGLPIGLTDAITNGSLGRGLPDHAVLARCADPLS